MLLESSRIKLQRLSQYKDTMIHIEPLSHSGKSLLSGMNPKDTTEPDAAVADYLANGGVITTVPAKKYRSHSARTKSHMKGGPGSRYLSGGTRNQAGRSRRVS